MSFQQLETAAIRVFRLSSPNERELARVTRELSLHPHDAEAMLGFAAQPCFNRYGKTSIVCIPWVTFDPQHNELVESEVDLLWQDRTLVVVTKGQGQLADDVVDEILHDSAGRRYQSPIEVVAECLARIVTDYRQTTANFFTSLSPSLQDDDQACLHNRLSQFADISATVATALPSVIPSATRLRFTLFSHQLRSTAQRVQTTPRSVTKPIDHTIATMPRIAHGYVIASAVIILVVALVTSV